MGHGRLSYIQFKYVMVELGAMYGYCLYTLYRIPHHFYLHIITFFQDLRRAALRNIHETL